MFKPLGNLVMDKSVVFEKFLILKLSRVSTNAKEGGKGRVGGVSMVKTGTVGPLLIPLGICRKYLWTSN